MKITEIKKSINNEMNYLISSDFDSVIKKIEKRKGVIVNMDNSRSKKRMLWGASLVAATMLIVFAGVFGFSKLNKDNVNLLATVILDVNPSLEIKVSEDEKIIEVVTYNDDAKKVMEGMDLKGVELGVGTNAILGSMLKNGYIDSAKNSILVTVLGDNQTKNKEIQDKVAGDIDAYFTTNSVDGSVMSQTVISTSEVEALATKYNISVGKVELINKILAGNPLYTFEDLVNLSTTDLNLLANSKKNNVTGITTTGAASQSEYIGRDRALEIATENIKTTPSNVKNIEIELDYDDGLMLYDVEFDYNGYEYDFEIDAINGKIISSDKGKEDKYDDDVYEANATTTGKYISRDEAKNIAIKHAGVTNYYEFDIEFDYDYGHAVYEVEFETNTAEYEYIINAETGDIIYSEKDNEDDDRNSSNNTSSNNNTNTTSTSLISKAEAKSIALKHAGVSDYFEYEIELDTDDGIKVYEVSFETKLYEYDYEINAKTGKIIKVDKERADD